MISTEALTVPDAIPTPQRVGWRLEEEKHLTGENLLGGSGFLTTGVLMVLGAGTSRGLLELGSRDGDSGCTRGAGRGTVLTGVLAGFRGASGG